MSGKVLEIVLKMSLIGCYSFIIVLLVRFLILKLLRAPQEICLLSLDGGLSESLPSLFCPGAGKSDPAGGGSVF